MLPHPLVLLTTPNKFFRHAGYLLYILPPENNIPAVAGGSEWHTTRSYRYVCSSNLKSHLLFILNHPCHATTGNCRGQPAREEKKLTEGKNLEAAFPAQNQPTHSLLIYRIVSALTPDLSLLPLLLLPVLFSSLPLNPALRGACLPAEQNVHSLQGRLHLPLYWRCWCWCSLPMQLETLQSASKWKTTPNKKPQPPTKPSCCRHVCIPSCKATRYYKQPSEWGTDVRKSAKVG